jgi:hypothetical protein
MRFVYVHWYPGMQMHLSKDALPAGDCVLSGHTAIDVGDAQYEFAAHAGQSKLEPTLREYLPRAQAVHAEAPMAGA